MGTAQSIRRRASEQKLISAASSVVHKERRSIVIPSTTSPAARYAVEPASKADGSSGIVCSAETNNQERDLSWEPDYFTEGHKALIRETWSPFLEDLMSCGIEVFLKIFQLQPLVKELFAFRDTPLEDLPRHPQFKSHSIRFMRAVQITVDNLNALDVVVVPNLLFLGRHHTNMTGFSIDYLQLFREAMHDVWGSRVERYAERQDLREAWDQLFCFIIEKLTTGHNAAASEKRLLTATASDSVTAKMARDFSASVIKEEDEGEEEKQDKVERLTG